MEGLWYEICFELELCSAKMEEIVMIKKIKDGYRVVSEKSGRNFGTYKTKEEAKERLRQVEYFKHRGDKHPQKKK